VWKNRIAGFVTGLALGILGTAGAVLIGQSGDPGELAGLDRANQRGTERTVESLERVIGEQRERINDLEASNNRLQINNRDAGRIAQQLTISTGATASDIRSAIGLLRTITDQVKSLNRVLNSGDTGSDSGNGVDNVENL
jgi:hypothetical protein